MKGETFCVLCKSRVREWDDKILSHLRTHNDTRYTKHSTISDLKRIRSRRVRLLQLKMFTKRPVDREVDKQ